MKILLLSSRSTERSYSQDVYHYLQNEGLEVWIDWLIHPDRYEEQMKTMIDQSDMTIYLIGSENYCSDSNPEWKAAHLSRTPKLVLLLNGIAYPTVNNTFTVMSISEKEMVPEIILRHVKEQLDLTLFISYARLDAVHVDKLLELISKSLARVWIDKSGLMPGEQFPDAILKAIETNKWFILVWSRQSSKSAWVKKEWSYAYDLNKKIIPILLDSTPLPDSLRNTQAFTSIYDEALYNFLRIPDGKRPRQPVSINKLKHRILAFYEQAVKLIRR